MMSATDIQQYFIQLQSHFITFLLHVVDVVTLHSPHFDYLEMYSTALEKFRL